MSRRPPRSKHSDTHLSYTTLFRSIEARKVFSADVFVPYRMRRISFQLLRGHVAERRGSDCLVRLLFEGQHHRRGKHPLLEEAAFEIENLVADDRRDTAA